MIIFLENILRKNNLIYYHCRSQIGWAHDLSLWYDDSAG